MDNAVTSTELLGSATAPRRDLTVFMTFDQNYAPYAEVALLSLLINTPDRDFELVLFTFDLESGQRERFAALAAKFGVAIRHVVVDENLFAGFDVSHHVSRAAYLLLYVPELIATAHALYLDPDIIVQDDIAPLLDIACNVDLLAGVEQHIAKDTIKQRLGLPPDAPYVNTGVLAINVATWKSEKLWARAQQINEEYRERLRWWDQDLINVLLSGRIRLLDRKWNDCQFEYDVHDLKRSGLDLDSFRGIFHFNSPTKPWMAWADPMAKSLFRRYASVLPLDEKFYLRPTSLPEAGKYAESLETEGRHEEASRVRKNIIASLIQSRSPHQG